MCFQHSKSRLITWNCCDCVVCCVRKFHLNVCQSICAIEFPFLNKQSPVCLCSRLPFRKKDHAKIFFPHAIQRLLQCTPSAVNHSSSAQQVFVFYSYSESVMLAQVVKHATIYPGPRFISCWAFLPPSFPYRSLNILNLHRGRRLVSNI